jgi:hypothetical protein
MNSYYIIHGDHKEGPHDLVTVMRRIRKGKISRDTLIAHTADEEPQKACTIPELIIFFESSNQTIKSHRAGLQFSTLLKNSWQFVQEEYTLTIFSGVILLVSLLIYFVLEDTLGMLRSGVLAWVVFVVFHNIYLVFALRSYRQQTHGAEFISQFIAPILATLVLVSIMLALMIAGGLLFLIVPGIFVAVAYIFVPFLVYDRKFGPVEAMVASRLLLQKSGRSYLPLIFLLVFCHLLCLILIAPIPVTLPMYACALSKIYEEMLAA